MSLIKVYPGHPNRKPFTLAMSRKDNLGTTLIPGGDTDIGKKSNERVVARGRFDRYINDKLVVDSRVISPISFSCEEMKDGLYKASRCIAELKKKKNTESSSLKPGLHYRKFLARFV